MVTDEEKTMIKSCLFAQVIMRGMPLSFKSAVAELKFDYGHCRRKQCRVWFW
jgi:hypothetical protein